jgi:hypothetical protein
MAADPDDIHKQALDHAWKWFDLHAAQRMQTFNFFLVATAFLVAAYASLLDKHCLAALFVALVGAWIAFWFTRLDNRTRQLIDAGEDVLKVSQARLAEAANIAALKISEKVEKPTECAFTYGVIIAVIEWTIVVVFILAAGYALFLLARQLGL